MRIPFFERKNAVQVPIKILEKMEKILENYALVQLMKENQGEETLSINVTLLKKFRRVRLDIGFIVRELDSLKFCHSCESRNP